MPKTNFVALDLTHDFRNEIHQICVQIKEQIKDYEFIPMDEENLHMTLCFLGSVLMENRKNKMLTIDCNGQIFANEFGGKILEFDQYSLFPDSKKNLIVAKFKCSDKNFIADMIKFKKMFCKIGAKEENYFTPHVTLGKIQGVKANANIDLSSIPRIVSNIEITGCHMV